MNFITSTISQCFILSIFFWGCSPSGVVVTLKGEVAPPSGIYKITLLKPNGEALAGGETKIVQGKQGDQVLSLRITTPAIFSGESSADVYVKVEARSSEADDANIVGVGGALVELIAGDFPETDIALSQDIRPLDEALSASYSSDYQFSSDDPPAFENVVEGNTIAVSSELADGLPVGKAVLWFKQGQDYTQIGEVVGNVDAAPTSLSNPFDSMRLITIENAEFVVSWEIGISAVGDLESPAGWVLYRGTLNDGLRALLATHLAEGMTFDRLLNLGALSVKHSGFAVAQATADNFPGARGHVEHVRNYSTPEESGESCCTPVTIPDAGCSNTFRCDEDLNENGSFEQPESADEESGILALIEMMNSSLDDLEGIADLGVSSDRNNAAGDFSSCLIDTRDNVDMILNAADASAAALVSASSVAAKASVGVVQQRAVSLLGSVGSDGESLLCALEAYEKLSVVELEAANSGDTF